MDSSQIERDAIKAEEEREAVAAAAAAPDTLNPLKDRSSWLRRQRKRPGLVGLVVGSAAMHAVLTQRCGWAWGAKTRMWETTARPLLRTQG